MSKPTPAEMDALRRFGLVWNGIEYEEENTMTERIDHAAEAREWIRDAPMEYQQNNGQRAQLCAALAQAEATLALVEQQRIQNLIALSQAGDGNGWQVAEPLDALFAYRSPDPEDGFGGLHVRPEIAAALGINPKEEA